MFFLYVENPVWETWKPLSLKKGASFHLLFGFFSICVVAQGLTCPSTPSTGAIVKASLQEIDFVRHLEEGLLELDMGRDGPLKDSIIFKTQGWEVALLMKA